MSILISKLDNTQLETCHSQLIIHHLLNKQQKCTNSYAMILFQIQQFSDHLKFSHLLCVSLFQSLIMSFILINRVILRLNYRH